MSLQTFFLRGTAATVAAGAVACGALALVQPGHRAAGPKPVVAQTAPAPGAATASAPGSVSTAPPIRSASADSVNLPAAAAPTAATMTPSPQPPRVAPAVTASVNANPAAPATAVIPMPSPAPPATAPATLSVPTVPLPPPHTTHRVQHAAPRPAGPSSISRQNADKFVHTRANGGAIEQPPRRQGPPSPYVTYDPGVRSPYTDQPWYYRRVY